VTYLDLLAGAIHDAVPSEALPGEDTADLFRLYAVLLLAKGEGVTPEDVHNAWVAWMASKGEDHESMVPFADLPDETQTEDSPFVVAIRSVAQSAKGPGEGVR
jgi:hypothetical protein